MSNNFNPAYSTRRLELQFQDFAKKQMARRASEALKAVRAEQEQMFRYLATSFIGRKSVPSEFQSVLMAEKGKPLPSISWPGLSREYNDRKGYAKDRFFLRTGALAKSLSSISGVGFAGAGHVVFVNDKGRFVARGDSMRAVVYMMPKMSSYPNFKGLEDHSAFAGFSEKFFVKGELKRPLLQPFMHHMSIRLKNAVARRFKNETSSASSMGVRFSNSATRGRAGSF